jgi:hypothetical protein
VEKEVRNVGSFNNNFDWSWEPSWISGFNSKSVPLKVLKFEFYYFNKIFGVSQSQPK